MTAGADVAAEIRRRAQRTCTRCGGFGVPGASRLTLAIDVCPRCFGTGYEDDPKLLAIAERIERAANESR